MLQHVVKKLFSLKEDGINVTQVLNILEEVTMQDVSLNDFFNDVHELKDYSKRIVATGIFSVNIVYWPPLKGSDIHHHLNFWGVIKVLKGRIMEDEFKYDEGEKTLFRINHQNYGAGDYLFEKTNAIHKLSNNSEEEAITLHVYYPPAPDLAGCRVFDIPERRLGVLNSSADSFSWKNPGSAFFLIQSQAFHYQDKKEAGDFDSDPINQK